MNKQQLEMAGVEAMEAAVCGHLDSLGLDFPRKLPKARDMSEVATVLGNAAFDMGTDLPSLEPVPRMRIASAFTEAQKLANQILEALERDDGTGICIGCRHEQGQCEPRTRALACEACGEHKVYGIQELVLMGYAETEE